MKKILNMCIAVFAGVMIGITSAHALGLGDITVKSGLNEPLRAQIPLLKLGDVTEEQLRIGLAPSAEFARQNLVYSAAYTGMHFRVDLKNTAGPVVMVTTDAAIKEPSLDLLVELTWPNGKIVRSYIVLLERP